MFEFGESLAAFVFESHVLFASIGVGCCLVWSRAHVQYVQVGTQTDRWARLIVGTHLANRGVLLPQGLTRKQS